MDVHGLLIVDKPRGLTSHDVVARIRRLLRTRKVGHAGTIDPAAEGLLIVAVGRATKLLGNLSSSSKGYAAHVVLGVGSETGDIEGPVIESPMTSREPTVDDVERVIDQFTGIIDQVPPAHSAIKVGGVPLYRRARRGDDVDVPVRQVRIDSIELLSYRYPDLFIHIECSAGTFVRALARDIGESLGTSAYLHYLLRTRSGRFTLSGAWPLDVLNRRLSPESFSQFSLHPALYSLDTSALALDPDGINAWYDGRPVPVLSSGGIGPQVHAFDVDGWWLGSGEYDSRRNAYQPKLVVRE